MGKFWRTDPKTGKRERTKAGLKREYQLYQSSSKQKAERAARNNARRAALRKGIVHKGDGKDIDHRDSNPLHNNPRNLVVMSEHRNRGKRENSRKRGSKRSRYGN